MRLRSGSLSAIALFQKVHLRLRFFCLFAFTELTLLMHRIGTFANTAMRLRSGGLSAIALLQKVHLRLRAGCLSAIALFQKVHLRLRFFAYLRSPNWHFWCTRFASLPKVQCGYFCLLICAHQICALAHCEWTHSSGTTWIAVCSLAGRGSTSVAN